ncbi:MauE/DoxX family redox-associated membrane protein [Galbibacter sp.]|uniref:MauE/DoxX family redox-associated membrane protein n=1 Tax=Galbibacter sp. TaxID=2918471 RepID=UPI003A903C11
MKLGKKYSGIIIEIIRFLFIVLFVYAGLTKLMEGDRFFNNLNNSPILPGGATAYILSWGVPTLEIVLAFFVAWPRSRLKGLYGALGLMILFTLYVAGIVFFSPYTPCSCGGVLTLLTWPQHLIVNISFVLLAVLAIRLYHRRKLSNVELFHDKVE